MRLMPSMLFAAVALGAAPAALACEDPRNIIIALRETVPETVEPGEVVLEVDRASMETIKAREEVIVFDKPAVRYPSGEPGPSEFRYDISYATFRVVRVVQGEFADALARIEVSLWSTCKFISGPEGRFLVGRPTVDSEGIHYVAAHWLTAAEYDQQYERYQKAHN